jgi:hypothetical protein
MYGGKIELDHSISASRKVTKHPETFFCHSSFCHIKTVVE